MAQGDCAAGFYAADILAAANIQKKARKIIQYKKFTGRQNCRPVNLLRQTLFSIFFVAYGPATRKHYHFYRLEREVVRNNYERL